MESYSEKTIAALQASDFLEVQVQLEKALKLDESEILASLGEQLSGAGFIEEAEKVYLKLLERHPEEVGLYISLAEIEIEYDNIDRALKLLEKIPKNHPAYPEALLVTADLYQVLEMPEISEKKLKEAKGILPDEPILDFALGELYFTTDKFSQALELYQGLSEQNIDHVMEVSVDDRIGSALGMLGEFEEAVTYLERANKENKTDDRLFQLAITYIQLEERQKAISLLQELRLLNPRYSNLYMPLASALADENMLEEALEVAKEGIEQDQFILSLYRIYADICYSLGRLEDGEEMLRQGLKVDNEDEFLRMKLANILLTEERYEDVLDTLSSMTESDFGQAYWLLAQAYNGLEDFNESKKYYKKAKESLMEDPAFLKDYGLFLREDGQIEESRHMLAHYLEYVPEDMDIQTLQE